MRLKKLIKRFIFEEGNRQCLTLGANVRLDPAANSIQLQPDASGAFPTTAGLFAKTWVAFPASVKGWLGFEAVARHGFDDANAPVTSLGFRLNDGAQDYWWNGSAWVANSSSWNTEADIANHIATFPVASRQLQVVMNLVTTDPKQTPMVEMIKVLYASDIEFQDDLINRSLLPALRNAIRPISDFPIKIEMATAFINMAVSYKLETPYNLRGIDSVFNHTDDPNHMVDILSSYDPNTKIITLNQTIAVGKTVWVRFYYEPEVAITTGQEYSEINRVPSIQLREINLINCVRIPQDDSVVNKSTGQGVKVQGPLQGDLDIVMLVLSDKARDQQFMADEVKRFFGENPFLRSKGLDKNYRVWLIDEYAQQTIPSQDEVHTARLRFRICNALFFDRPAIDVYAVQRFHLTGDTNAVVTP